MLERLQFENQSGGGDTEGRPVDLYDGGAAYVRRDYLVDRADFTAREHGYYPLLEPGARLRSRRSRRLQVGGNAGDVPIQRDDPIDVGVFMAGNEPAALGDSRETIVRPDAARAFLEEVQGAHAAGLEQSHCEQTHRRHVLGFYHQARSTVLPYPHTVNDFARAAAVSL